MYESLKREAAEAFEELCESGNLKRGNLIVIGGSSSEIRGGHIGKDSSYEVGTAVVSTLIEKADEKGLHLAFQCCEHLNRALIIERKIADELERTGDSSLYTTKEFANVSEAMTFYFRWFIDDSCIIVHLWEVKLVVL